MPSTVLALALIAPLIAPVRGIICDSYKTEAECRGCVSGGECVWDAGKGICAEDPDSPNCDAGDAAITAIDDEPSGCIAEGTDCPVMSEIAWVIPVATQEILATKAVEISWSGGFHNVYRMSSKDALDSCSFAAAEEVAPSGGSGSVTVPLPPAGSTHYYACEVGTHCEAGMKLAITGSPPIDPIPDPQPQPADSVSAIIKENPDLSKFEKLLEEHSLDDNLERPRPWTVFAPNDDAVDSVNGAMEILLALDENGVAKYHIIEGQQLASTDLADGLELETWQGAKLKVAIKDGAPVLVDGFDFEAKVVTADTVGDNGVVHVIDRMLFFAPQTSDDDPSSDAAPPSRALALATLLVAAAAAFAAL